MIFGLADRVQETSTTNGTGTLTLAGATTGFRTFSAALEDGAPVGYAITFGAEWETGIGIFTESNLLSRETVLSSSNAGALVNFAAGTKTVFISRLAGFQDAVLLIAGETISARDAVYLRVDDPNDDDDLFEYGRVYRCDAKDVLASTQCMFLGFATHAASAAGKPVLIKTGGTLAGFGALSPGTQIFLSNTVGAVTSIAPANRRLVGVYVTTDTIFINPHTQPTPVALEVTYGSIGMLGPGMFGAGLYSSSGATFRSTAVEYIDTYALTGNAAIRGAAGLAVSSYGVTKSATKVYLGGGVRGTSTPVIESAVQMGDRFVTTGAIADTGDMVSARFGLAAAGNNTTRGFFAGGKTAVGNSNEIDIITFASFTTTTSDCGDLMVARSYLGGGTAISGAGSVGLFAGGFTTTFQSLIDKIDVAVGGTQNATDRGELLVRKQSLVGLDSSFVTFAGGFNGRHLSDLEGVDSWTYSTIAMDRGELTVARSGLGTTGDTVLAGGTNGIELNIIEQVNTVGRAVNVFDRGDLTVARRSLSGD